MLGTAQRVVFVIVAVLVGAALLVSSVAPAEARQPELSARAPSAPPAVGGAPRPELERLMDQVVAAGAPGIVALINDASATNAGGDHGGRPWVDARGVANLRTRRPMRPQVRFRVASVTKSFVATVALQLVDEGRLALTDTVERWLPGILPYGDRVTLRQLLSHTSGVPEYEAAPTVELFRGDRFRSWQPRELVALVAEQPQLFPSGTAFSYANTNYVLAGLMIEQAAGRHLRSEVGRRILRPLRLRDTSFPVNFPWIRGRHARGYSLDLDDQLRPVEGPLRDFTVHDPSWVWAAGNIVSDIDDIARFYRALLGGRLLSPERLADMKTTVEAWPGMRYGLGLIAIDTPCGPLFGHSGGVPGFGNFAFTSEDGTRQLGLMINALYAPAAVAEPFSQAVMQALQEALAGAPCASQARNAEGRRRLYDSDQREAMTALADAGNLSMAPTPQEAASARH